MTAPQTVRSPAALPGAASERVIDLGGQAVHTFQFQVPLDLVYAYFHDVPRVFRLLPDALDMNMYAVDDYRLTVGASDGYGHTMAAVFDLHAAEEENHCIRLAPTENGPLMQSSGLIFPGQLWAEAVFTPARSVTLVEYTVEISLCIPIPGVLKMVPQTFLQSLGENAMGFKMTHMIDGFARRIDADFRRWIATN